MMNTRIPVAVVTGPFGAGKTTLLNRLLRPGCVQDDARRDDTGIVVLSAEAGMVAQEHGRAVHMNDNTALIPSACPCCAVQGDLVDALRNLFLQALHRKIPPLSRILVETAGMADPAAVMYTLKYDRFLGERYVYQGCIAVLDGQAGSEALHHPEVQRQAALADVVVISKTDSATPEHIRALHLAVHALNPGTACLAANEVRDLAALLEAGTFSGCTGTGISQSRLWSGKKLGRQTPAKLDITVLTLAWPAPLRRSVFARAVDWLQSPSAPIMIRIQGRVWFMGASGPSLVHGVHQQLYVMDGVQSTDASAIAEDRAGTQTPGLADGMSMLTLVFRGLEKARLQDELLALMPGGEAIVSPGRNFMHGGIALHAM
jgi:G3E family GTPase